VNAAELEASASRSVRLLDRVLEEPEPNLCRAVVREAIKAEVHDEVADVVVARIDRVDVSRRVCIRDVVLVERFARLIQPLVDVEIIL
jgi:GTPase Era involved in 16S rRNA processing